MKKCASFEEQKIVYKLYSGKRLFWHYCQQLPFVYKAFLIFLLICFNRVARGFYQSSVRNDVDFRDIMNVSQNILVKNQNFKNLRLNFVDKRALVTRKVISSCHWKNHVTFCLQKKKPENAFSTVTVLKITRSCRKRCHPKQQ